MWNNWINKKSDISINDISFIEDCFKVKFPSEFIDFILENNGAEPLKKTIRFLDGEVETVKSILSFSAKDTNYILSAYKNKAAFLPDKIVPLAETDYIDLICFDFRKDSYPTIVYWNYEWAVEVASKCMEEGEQFYKICSNFDEFLNKFE